MPDTQINIETLLTDQKYRDLNARLSGIAVEELAKLDLDVESPIRVGNFDLGDGTFVFGIIIRQP